MVECRLILVWTDKLGEELWEISKLVTRHTEIKASYINLNATVKDGKELLKDIMGNIQKMIKSKINSVKCIAQTAEDLRRDTYFMNDFKLEYYNMKYSNVEGSGYTPTVPWDMDEFTEYKNMSLTPNPNFYNIPVNTNHSAVHIPTNVYDRYQHLAETITWSESLDEVFLRNYRSDPSLSWQYFGSAFGMMRQFPAMQWSTKDNEVDLYDCRMRPWFIEAATCTKDVIILMDNSGSMTGMRNTIAKLVVNSLLKTFGNNDFINVLKFSWKPTSVLPCYKDMLIQATPEVLKSFQEAVTLVKPEGNASFPNAISYSLKLLKEYRENRILADDGGCNQAIMLVTDGLPGNVTDVFENLNLDENGMPLVRIFTFLVGTEVKGVEELQLMACRNRGYYVHIHDLDEVHDQVLKYIPVIARPLVLQGTQHPVIWTHAFADVNDPKLTKWLWKVMNAEEQGKRLLEHQNIRPEFLSKQREDSLYVQKITQVCPVANVTLGQDHTQGEEKNIEYQEYKLMTSVSMPTFDKRENNETKTAELLGVAGVDVSLDQIYSMTYPYKTGANGYLIIVNNNGYLLMHPDFRPVYDGTLKINYNSIDLAEVEFLDDDNDGYKEYSPDILSIRQSMVDQINKDYLEKPVKFHYDDMQRIGIEKRNYYIRPLPNTPFSIGLVVPSDFTSYRISKSVKFNSELNVTEEPFAADKYLKIQDTNERDPEWMIHPDWPYCKYHFPTYKSFDSKEEELMHFLERMGDSDWEWKEQYETKGFDEDDCDQIELEEDAYYCDQDLVELLIVDSEILKDFGKPRKPKNSFETRLLDTYNPNLRFVAAQSGLVKWQLIPKPRPEENTTSDFISAYPRSVDEPWYRMAVLQHQVDEESFAFSVPFKSGEADSVSVVATHAIFHKKTHDGKKGPAAIVGYSFEQSSFYDRFMDITSETDRFTLPCHSDARECYILDHNGYIVVSSKSVNETGHFFGEFESSVMSHLIKIGIYHEKVIYDYQGLCIEEIAVTNNANFLSTVAEFRDYDSDEIPDDDEDEYEIEKEEVLNATVRIERNTWPCHKNKTLYILQQNVFAEKFIYGVRHNSSRFRFVNRIPHTNLILVVLNTLYSPSDDFVLTTEPNILPPEDCRDSSIFDLPRRRLSNCYTQHPEEVEVEACGRGLSLTASWTLILLCVLFLLRKIL
ncbi:hypothetical protein RUM43_003967 [Polyplax serrata]|uniref:VWFA domain-containing protein n=1 Tax=Polyplax serrata TaxID=468196 RepID=A0AAN8S8F3_POLSC